MTDFSKANKNHIKDLQTAHDEYTANQSQQAARLQRAEEKSKEFESRSTAANEKAEKAEASMAKTEQEKQAVQSELDDLLMVFGDLEEKVEKYKERLKVLGESVSDGEDEDADDDEEYEDENDVD